MSAMLSTQHRKGRWSRSFFGSRSTKTIEVFQDSSPAPKSSTTESSRQESVQAKSSLGLSKRKRTSEASQKPKVKVRRGSKVLTFLGIRQSLDGGKDTPNSPTLPSDSSIATDLDRTFAPSAQVCGPLVPKPSIFKESSHNFRSGTTPRPPTSSKRVDTPVGLDFKIIAEQSTGGDTSSTVTHTNMPLDAKVVPLEVYTKKRDSSGLRQSKSMPGIAHQLSHKLSTTFGNPTVVHRPGLKGRPSLMSVHDFKPSNAAPEWSPAGDTDPSSLFYSGSVSPVQGSTEKTSLESNIASTSSVVHRDRPNKPTTQINCTVILEEGPPSRSAPRLPEPTVVKPTMHTIESTANAKIFFETQFGKKLCGQSSPRSLRRQHLEELLCCELITPEERQLEREAWAKLESEHLRQTRVLETQSLKMVGSSGASVAGYEVIRILGKGSFGVVRLVREEGSDLDEMQRAAVESPQCAREEPSSLKITAVDTLKQRVSAQKSVLPKNSDRAKKDVFAMKVIRKSPMIRSCQESHLRAERDFLVAAESSRWIVPLVTSFQDETNLYLVMEYMIGGDFLGLLIRFDRLKEKVTRWYVAEMIQCIEEAHRLHWIHRDVKPDNFLISASGHLKISDFGLAFDGDWSHDKAYFNHHRYSLMEKLGIVVEGDAEDRKEAQSSKVAERVANIMHKRTKKSVERERHERPPVTDSEDEGLIRWRNRNGNRRLAESVVGTSQYMAPEVIRGDPYDGRCDWWSIAIIMFECLYGYTPFVDEDRTATKMRILRHEDELRFPTVTQDGRRLKISDEAKDLIDRILREKENRLCSRKYIMNDFEHTRRLNYPRASNHKKQQQKLHSTESRTSFVYADDACDIKRHPFFRDIDFDRIHLSRPPEVPKVSSREDTHYFDEEEPVSDPDDGRSNSSIDENELKQQEEFEAKVARDFYDDLARKQLEAEGKDGTKEPHRLAPGLELFQNHALAKSPKMPSTPTKKTNATKAKEKKRPRDRILRDKGVAKQVLELRKKGAFLGYTYRRPRRVLVNLENHMRRAGWDSVNVSVRSLGRIPTTIE